MVVAVALATVVLIGAWMIALRTHLRRDDHHSDWEGADERPMLWTSTARCQHCGATAGIVDEHAGRMFICLHCGRQRARRTRG